MDGELDANRLFEPPKITSNVVNREMRSMGYFVIALGTMLENVLRRSLNYKRSYTIEKLTSKFANKGINAQSKSRHQNYNNSIVPSTLLTLNESQSSESRISKISKISIKKSNGISNPSFRYFNRI